MGHSEDTAHQSSDVGEMSLTVRKDTATALAGSDGDYQPFITGDNGALWVIPNIAYGTGVDGATVPRVTLATDVPLPVGSNLVGDVGIQGRTTGGLSFFKSIDLDESEEEVKGSAGTVYGFTVINLGTVVNYLKFYNATAVSVTVGTTVPDLTYPIPTQAATASGAGITIAIPQGIAFGTAITVAATTGVADNDSGAPGANEVIIAVYYK